MSVVEKPIRKPATQVAVAAEVVPDGVPVMSAYTTVYDAAIDASHQLRKQVAVALQKVAVDIINESQGTADHAQREAWARRVKDDPVGMAERTIWYVLENATIQASPATAADGDVLFVVTSLVPTLMKVR